MNYIFPSELSIHFFVLNSDEIDASEMRTISIFNDVLDQQNLIEYIMRDLLHC